MKRSLLFTICSFAALLASCGKEPEQNNRSAALPQDVAAGRRAYDAQDYQTAFRIWSQLARQGDPGAQFWIGFLYESGYGVKQDKAEAVKWFLLASDQGQGDAQARLSRLLLLGQGAPQDTIQAYKWAELSSAYGQRIANETLSTLRDIMKPNEVKEAKRLVEEWKSQHAVSGKTQ